MRFGPVATELVFGASIWAYRDGGVRVVAIEHAGPPRYDAEPGGARK